MSWPHLCYLWSQKSCPSVPAQVQEAQIIYCCAQAEKSSLIKIKYLLIRRDRRNMALQLRIPIQVSARVEISAVCAMVGCIFMTNPINLL